MIADTIGKRAVKAIKANLRWGELTKTLKEIGIPRNTFESWMLGDVDPSAHYPKKMALAGYDVHWILTGKERQ